MAAAALAAEVDACLVTCGLVAAIARRFASVNGIESIDIFPSEPVEVVCYGGTRRGSPGPRRDSPP